MSRHGRARWVSGLLLLGASLGTTSAAYVQFQDCYDTLPQSTAISTFPKLRLEGLRASLDVSAKNAQLELNVTGSYPKVDKCDDLEIHNDSAPLQVSSLGSVSEAYSTKTSSFACHENSRSNRAILRRRLTYEIAQPRFLDSLDIVLHLDDSSNLPYSCLKAHITPAFTPLVSAIALWVPVGVFLTVLLVAFWHEISPMPSATFELGPFIRDTSPKHLTLVAQAISYIQFAFFSASLTLSYPGFLWAAASKASWSTLMIPHGPILSRSPYYGVKDGVYEVNGTFGGTAGLELMTQALGAPVTAETWANIISLSLILLSGMTILFQLGHRLPYTRDWISGDSARRMRGTTDFGVRGTAWTVLRLFLSYFLTPLTAWTTYQLTGAGHLPIYHIVLTAVVIMLLVVSFWWGVTQNSPRNMGYLLFDSSKRLQTPGRLSKSQDRYAMATFTLMFVRGAAFGGLQVAGMVQLLVLIACEVVQLLVMGFTWKSFPLTKVGGLLAGIRLAILGICVGFLPDVADHSVKTVLGLVILGIHAAVFVGVFFVPSLVRIGGLLAYCSCAGPRDRPAGEDGLEVYAASFPSRNAANELQEYRLRQLQPPRPISQQPLEAPCSPSSLLSSPIRTNFAMRPISIRDDARSLASGRRSRLSISSSGSDTSCHEPMRHEKPAVADEESDVDDGNDLGSPSFVCEARMGRRFSRASVLNCSRPLGDQPQSP